MKTLHFVGFYGKSFTSSLIRYFTRSRTYSHIAILITDKGQLIEAWPHKGGWKQWTDYSDIYKHTPGTKYEIWGLEVEDTAYDKCMKFYREQADNQVTYDYAGVISFLFKKTVKENPDRFFCSELAVYPLCDVFEWKTIKPHLVSPRDFINIIEASGGVKLENGCVSAVD